MTINITDHVLRALGALLPRFRESDRIKAIVEALVEELQELEDVIFESITKRYLAVAEGENLDVYGILLEQPRNGRTDEDYRRLLESKILANRGGSTPPVIGELAAKLFFSDDPLQARGARYILNAPAGYQLQVTPTKTDGVELHTHSNAASVDSEADSTSGWMGVGATPSSDSTDPFRGVFALKAVALLATFGGLEYDFLTTAGKTYRVSGAVKRGVGVDQRISGWTGVDDSPDIPIAGGDWQEFVVFVKATAAFATAKFRATDAAGSIGDEVFVDAITIEELVDLDPGHIADAIAMLLEATPAGVKLTHITSSPAAGAFKFSSSSSVDGPTSQFGFGRGKFAKLLL